MTTRAWRYWWASPEGRLRSISHRSVQWPPQRPLVARCLHGGHPAPAPGCACGIYGTAELAALRDHGLCVGTDPLVVGEVALFGEMVLDEDGMRAARALPLSLWLVTETAGDRLVELMEGLGAYGVAVSTMPAAEATDGATAAMLAFQAMSSPTSPRR